MPAQAQIEAIPACLHNERITFGTQFFAFKEGKWEGELQDDAAEAIRAIDPEGSVYKVTVDGKKATKKAAVAPVLPTV